MSLFDVTVRADWRTIEKQQFAADVRLRVELQIALAAFAIAAPILADLAHLRPAFGFAGIALFVAVYLALPGRNRTWALPGGRVTYIVSVSGLLLAATVIFVTSPSQFRPIWQGVPLLPPAVAVAAPAITALVAIWSHRRHPGLLRQLGWVGTRWARQVIAGGAIGVALGFHLWIVVAALPQRPPISLPPAAEMIWLIATITALRSPGEELALRGALFRVLTVDASWRKAEVWLRILVFNLPLYLALALGHPDPVIWLLCVAYGALFALAATALRVTFGSAVASLGASITFNLMLTLVALG
ncbi:MAG: hypothetical protein MUC34_01615 [Anaerolineae bacterium]|nr:hypothetical protein [Anaerolineae bacterium]